jgi:hypothetical protein
MSLSFSETSHSTMSTWFIVFIFQWDVSHHYVNVIYCLYLSVRRPPALCQRDCLSLSFSETSPITMSTWFIVFIFPWDVSQHYVNAVYCLYLSVRRPPALCYAVMFTLFHVFIFQWEIPHHYINVMYFLYLLVKRPPALYLRDLFSLSFSETCPITLLWCAWFKKICKDMPSTVQHQPVAKENLCQADWCTWPEGIIYFF